MSQNDVERETLARILIELDRLSYMSAMAHQEQSNKSRVQFNFQGLHQDIHHIKTNIQMYLADLPHEPRTLTSLEDDYLTMQRVD